MKLANENIEFSSDNCFAHSVWDDLFNDREYIYKDEIEIMEKIYNCKIAFFFYEDDMDEELLLCEANNPLSIWPLEMDINEDVLLGYYMTKDGYMQIWATESGNE